MPRGFGALSDFRQATYRMFAIEASDLELAMPRIETILAQTGCDPEPPSRDLVAPLHLSTTYERAADGSYPGAYVYTRNDNPTRRRLEEALAALDGGTDAAAFSSGMAAAAALFRSLRPGDHVLLPDDVYYGVRRLVRESFEPWGLTVSHVDMTRIDRVKEAMTRATRVVWAESPSNPMCRITDLRTMAGIAHAGGAAFVVDSTWTTPFLQRPLELGADFVLHSLTKYLAGHSDVLGGALVTAADDERWRRIRSEQRSAGAVMDPFSAWLTMRGMRSLAARMRLHCRNAKAVAAALNEHPRVTRVHYPGLAEHPGHTAAKRQMDDFGGMLSFQVEGTEPDALAVAARTKVFARATSLGGTESLIEHRASIEEQPTATPSNLIRLSVGLEHVDDLVEDLASALSG